MREEVCLFQKFGFCRNGDRCKRVHLKEVCSNRECDSRKCNKRHPRPCKFFRDNDFCKFNSECSFSHKLPKYVEDQNVKMEAMERKTGNLQKQIIDQNETIRILRNQLFESQKREVDRLQKQINDLKAKNDEKKKALKNLNEMIDCQNEDGELEEESEERDVELEEDVEVWSRDERLASLKKKGLNKFETKLVTNLFTLEEEVQKIRSNYTQLIKSKVKTFNGSMKEGRETITNKIYLNCLELLEKFENQKKINKEDLLAEITCCLYDIENV